MSGRDVDAMIAIYSLEIRTYSDRFKIAELKTYKKTYQNK